MPLTSTLELPSYAMQHSKQFLARGPWWYHRLVSASDLHNSVDYSRPRHDLVRQREHRPDFKEGSEEVGVVHHRDGKCVCDSRRRVGRLRFRATLKERVEQGDPPPIELHRVSIPGRHSLFSHGVVCEREHKRVIQVLSYDVYCAGSMHKAHRDSASAGGVCAGTRVAHTDDPRCDGNAVHDKTPVAVDDARHGQHAGDRLTVEPLGVQWTRAEESCPVLGIAQLLQRLVARGNEHGYGPGARVTGKGEEIKRMEVCLDPSAVGRNHPVLGAEKP